MTGERIFRPGAEASSSHSGTCGPHSQTTPSPSASRMYGYAGWLRGTGAMPWRRASAHVMRPLLFATSKK